MWRRTNRKTRKRNVRYAMFLSSLLIAGWAILSIIHVIGWLILTGALCGFFYFLGQRQTLDRFLPGRMRARESWQVNGRVAEANAVSAYPSELSEKYRHNSGYGQSPQRDRLLRDPRSGARPLHPER